MCTDAVTIVLYNTIVTFCDMPVIPGSQYGLAVLAFFTVSCGGIAVGAVCGLLTALITRTTQECRGMYLLHVYIVYCRNILQYLTNS
jgi:NhaP-type Na+/H+ or K+/H+ antiporter